MNVLIVENEVYLAKSIATKLSCLGYDCHLVSNITEALYDVTYDAVLLSTNIAGQNFYPVIEKHKKSIIILMISYISNDTVSNPIKAGANDYIQKPFMIEELIRKLEHLKQFNMMKSQNRTYEQYLEFFFKNSHVKRINVKTKLPIVLKSKHQRSMDFYMFELSKLLNKGFEMVCLSKIENLHRVINKSDDKILYLINHSYMKKNSKNTVLEMIKGKQIVLSTTDMDETFDFPTIEIDAKNGSFSGDDILTLEDYVKFVICKFQSIFPDTELAKRLGISRKSLWEKRKKYGISKEK